MDDTSSNNDLFSTPELLHVADLAYHRSQELQTLLNELGSRQDKKRTALQILPRYMRRRAASYNIKRLPRKIRQIADPKTGSAKTKRPSRRYRRRPKNLLSTYMNRQRKIKWLKTHIWHAKRFHMKTLWSYRLSLYSNTKCARPTYQSLKDRCLIHDMSYYGCIQLEGNEQYLVDKLSLLCHSSTTGLSPAAKMYRSGQYEGQCLVYKQKSYPYNCIGPISFLWMPVVDQHLPSTNRKIWLWCHPSSHDCLITELQSLFDLEQQQVEFETTTDNEPPVKKRKNDEKITSPISSIESVELKHKLKPIVSSKPITYKNDNVKICLLREHLARFRLTGPRSLLSLKHVLHVSQIPTHDNQIKYIKKTAPIHWWFDYLNEQDNKTIYEKQQEFWNSQIKNLVIPNKIISLVVRDPRIFLPKKPDPLSFNSVSDNNDTETERKESTINNNENLAYSPLWNEKHRYSCSEYKLATYQINLLRSKSSSIGEDLKLGDKESQIPVILIHHHDLMSTPSQSLSTPNDFGSGWDIILPIDWAQEFWIPFIYSGARPIGQKELNLVYHETGKCQFPQDYPDTDAGRLWAAMIEDEKLEAYSKRPPSKRPNYLIIGIRSPFRPLWSNIVHEWASQFSIDKEHPIDHFYVLRDRHLLQSIRSQCSRKQNKSLQQPLIDQLLSHLHSLVSIRLKMNDKGTMDNFTLIYLPNLEDFTQQKTPVESKHRNQAYIDELKQKKAKKSFRKGEAMVNYLRNKPQSNEQIISDCDRKMIGALTNGSFTFSLATSTGDGFIAMGALLTLLNQEFNKNRHVLIRTTTTQYYSWATVHF